jgi:hypothetical protein
MYSNRHTRLAGTYLRHRFSNALTKREAAIRRRQTKRRVKRLAKKKALLAKQKALRK